MNKKEALKNYNNIINRASEWSLNTVIWSYYNTEIIITNIKTEAKEPHTNEWKKNIIKKISLGHIRYQNSLLTYVIYFLGACAENLKINNKEFKFEKFFISNLINHFFVTVDKYLKDSSLGFQPCLVELDNKNYDFNKSIIKAHQPKLNKLEINSISNWFVDNYKKDMNIQKLFIGASHYFYLENTGIMDKVAGPGKSNTKALLSFKPKLFNKFIGTGLSKDCSLRLSYIYLNETLSSKVYDCYVSKCSKLSNKIKKYSKGPWIKFFKLKSESIYKIILPLFKSKGFHYTDFEKPKSKEAKKIKKIIRLMNNEDLVDLMIFLDELSNTMRQDNFIEENNDIISLRGFIEGISEDKQYKILEINNLI
mgnify:FL=1